jgi:transposase-like protein
MAMKWCPEKKLEIILDFYDSDVKIVPFAQSYDISTPTIRKWIRTFEVFGLRGLCSDAEWRERKQMYLYETFDKKKLKCCENYNLSKEVGDYINNKEHFVM